MPMSTKEAQRAYQREWVQKRRNAWLQQNGPCKKCGSTEKLEVDHIDRKTKINHKVWTWSQIRRDEELQKCQVLCKKCHVEKTAADMGYRQHGDSGYHRGCRCKICKDVAVKRVNEYRWRTGKRKKRCGQVDLVDTPDCYSGGPGAEPGTAAKIPRAVKTTQGLSRTIPRGEEASQP